MNDDKTEDWEIYIVKMLQKEMINLKIKKMRHEVAWRDGRAKDGL